MKWLQKYKHLHCSNYVMRRGWGGVDLQARFVVLNQAEVFEQQTVQMRAGREAESGIAEQAKHESGNQTRGRGRFSLLR